MTKLEFFWDVGSPYTYLASTQLAGLRARTGVDIEYRPLSNTQFVADLSSCRAVFATAGNQLISEAMHFGKPLNFSSQDTYPQIATSIMKEIESLAS